MTITPEDGFKGGFATLLALVNSLGMLMMLLAALDGGEDGSEDASRLSREDARHRLFVVGLLLVFTAMLLGAQVLHHDPPPRTLIPAPI